MFPMSREREIWWARLFLDIWKRQRGFRCCTLLRRRFLRNFSRFLLKHKLLPQDILWPADVVTSREWRQLLFRLAHLPAI